MVMTPQASTLSLTRNETWNTNVVGVASVSFEEADSCRRFFNNGGEITINIIHPCGSSDQDRSWNKLLQGVGTVKLSATSTTRSGTLGSTMGGGFASLTTVDTIVFDGTNIGPGVFEANDVYVAARINARANCVIVTVTLQDQYISTVSDLVSAGTTCLITACTPHAFNGAEEPVLFAVQNFV